MLEDSFRDNFRQTGVVVKYEFKKYFRGKKMTIFAALMGIVLVVFTFMPYILGGGLSEDPMELAFSYTSIIQLLILLAVTLFVSGTIVSEFEERTALVMFTKPLKKWSIFLGKMFAACMVGFAFVLLYYGITAVISLVVTGSVASPMLTSLGLALAYTLGASGIAVLISSVVKKSSVAAILTFVTLMLLLTIVSSILSGNSIDTWFMLDVAGTNINASFTPGYYDAARDAAVMSAWGLAAGAAGYLLFRRREL